jgi:hypothetical protein
MGTRRVPLYTDGTVQWWQVQPPPTFPLMYALNAQLMHIFHSLEGYLGFEVEMDDLSEDRIWRIGYDIAMVSSCSCNKCLAYTVTHLFCRDSLIYTEQALFIWILSLPISY